MMSEIAEVPEAIRRQSHALRSPIAEVVRRCQRRPPRLVLTCARGSSAHAATFGKHLIERYLAIPVSAAAPNIASVYRQRLQLKDQLLLTISQSGSSNDLIEYASMARDAGALTVAIVNDVNSPLAKVSEIILPMAAGPEFNVAATKSFIATLGVLLRLVADWGDNNPLHVAIQNLPERLIAITEIDWTNALGLLEAADSLVTVGRGPTLAIAREAALKFKEICDLQAEPFSSAEFQHGPMSIVTSGFPVLVFMPGDEAGTGLPELASDLIRKGAALLMTGVSVEGAVQLPTLASEHPDTDPVCVMQIFYRFALQLAAKRGVDWTRPRHLQKVTRTR